MFETVLKFENKIAEFFNAPFAVATDSCTHAIEISLRHKKHDSTFCPKHTYLSIPMTFMKLGLDWKFTDCNWQDFYYITDDIIDAAVTWKKNGYVDGTLMCISFQYKKHLSLGRGGAILCDTHDDYISLKKMSYDGRLPDKPWVEQNIDTIGYHYYMTPETAQLGIDKLPNAIETVPKDWNYSDYPDLSKMEIFNAYC